MFVNEKEADWSAHKQTLKQTKKKSFKDGCVSQNSLEKLHGEFEGGHKCHFVKTPFAKMQHFLSISQLHLLSNNMNPSDAVPVSSAKAFDSEPARGSHILRAAPHVSSKQLFAISAALAAAHDVTR